MRYKILPLCSASKSKAVLEHMVPKLMLFLGKSVIVNCYHFLPGILLSPSCIASPTYDQYQVTLLSKKYKCKNNIAYGYHMTVPH